MKSLVMLSLGLSLAMALPAAAAEVTLVENGQPAAVVVTAPEPSKTVAYAVKELVDHIKLVSGAELPVTTENQIDKDDTRARIIVGPCKMASAIYRKKPKPENTVVMVRRNQVLLLGGDVRDFEPSPSALGAHGTLYAVYDFLETELGVRWLWPGDAGIVAPKKATIRIAETSRTFAPVLIQRQIRAGAGVNRASTAEVTEKALVAHGWTPEHEQQKLDAFNVWARRRRMGRANAFKFGHAYNNWLEKYGKEHPDWFAMMPDGRRVTPEKPYPSVERAKLCTTNEELIDFVAKEGMEYLKNHSAFISFSACPNDSRGYCFCPKCRELDPPEGIKDIMNYPGRPDFLYPSLSDRHVRFWNAIAERMGDQFPGKYIGVYAYSNYRHAPLREKPSPRLVVAYVGYNYFNNAYNEQSRKDWDGWSAHGSKMFLRPNLLLTGHGFPANYARELAADFKECAAKGLIGTDFDSMTHHYAAQAPVFDMLMRLMWDPQTDIEAAYTDFLTSAYGAAEPAMRRYWDTLERLTKSVAQKVSLRTTHVEEGAEVARFEDVVHTVYTPDEFAAMRAMLDEARRLAADDPAALQRIEIASIGMEYGEVQSGILRAFREFCRTQGANVAEVKAILQRKDALFTTHCNDLTLGLRHVLRYETAAYYARQYASNFNDYFNRPGALRWFIEWQFKTDPENTGEKLGYARPDFNDTEWMMVSSMGAWEQQNVPYYDGFGWFRLRLDASEDWKRFKTLPLEFHGVGNTFHLYVNGKLVHEMEPGSTARYPLSVDLKPHLRLGQENSVVVRVHNAKGGGGLLKPVMLLGRE